MLRKFSKLVFAVSFLVVVSGGYRAARADDLLNTPKAVFEKIKSCFKPPPLPRGNPGMEITVHFSVKRSGELFGHPRITYESPEASDEDRLKYRIAIMDALKTCTPLSLTEGLGNAIAGRPFRILFDDRRNLKPI